MISRDIKTIIELQNLYGSILSQKKINPVDVDLCVLIKEMITITNWFEMMVSPSISLKDVRSLRYVIELQFENVVKKVKELKQRLREYPSTKKNLAFAFKSFESAFNNHDR